MSKLFLRDLVNSTSLVKTPVVLLLKVMVDFFLRGVLLSPSSFKV